MPDKPQGWVNDPAAVEAIVAGLPRPVFGLAAHKLKDSGSGKVTLLYAYTRKLLGKDLVKNQTIGDCVSQAGSGCVESLAGIEIVLLGENEEHHGEIATELGYGGSRIEIGRGALRGDGSIGAWHAKFLQQYGAIFRGKFEVNGRTYDFSTYSGPKARELGSRGVGVPDDLEPLLRKHQVRTVSLVQSYEEVRDAIHNGYPVSLCSNRGFDDRRGRDSEGFARPSGTWNHAMYADAVDDAHGRPGCLVRNSWSRNHMAGTPKRHDQPDGSFWVDADVIDYMARQNDSFAHSGYNGYPGQELPDPFPWIRD